MDIHIIAAIDIAGALGKDKTMAWYVPQELRHFKKMTMDGVLIMGRVTFESIGRSLPGRVTIVVSSNPAPKHYPDTHWVTSMNEAIMFATAVYSGRRIWVSGGENVYSQMIDKVTHLHISRMPFKVDAPDAFFPSIDTDIWECVATKEVLEKDGALLFTTFEYKRK